MQIRDLIEISPTVAAAAGHFSFKVTNLLDKV